LKDGLRTPSKKFLIQTLNGFRWGGVQVTLALSGTQNALRNCNLLLRAHDEQPVGRYRIKSSAHLFTKGTNLKKSTNIAVAPTTNAKTCKARLGVIAPNKIAAIKGARATLLFPYGTPIFSPQTLHVAGTAGPKNALRSFEMPGLLQCGHVYIEFLFERANEWRLSAAKPAVYKRHCGVSWVQKSSEFSNKS
jgi:hypothetical protein